MNEYLRKVCLLRDDELVDEVRRQRVQERTLWGPAREAAYGRLVVLWRFLDDSEKPELYHEAVAADRAEIERLRAANAAGRVR